MGHAVGGSGGRFFGKDEGRLCQGRGAYGVGVGSGGDSSGVAVGSEGGSSGVAVGSGGGCSGVAVGPGGGSCGVGVGSGGRVGSGVEVGSGGRVGSEVEVAPGGRVEVGSGGGWVSAGVGVCSGSGVGVGVWIGSGSLSGGSGVGVGVLAGPISQLSRLLRVGVGSWITDKRGRWRPVPGITLSESPESLLAESSLLPLPPSMLPTMITRKAATTRNIQRGGPGSWLLTILLSVW
jgi:hypothetical protein